MSEEQPHSTRGMLYNDIELVTAGLLNRENHRRMLREGDTGERLWISRHIDRGVECLQFFLTGME